MREGVGTASSVEVTVELILLFFSVIYFWGIWEGAVWARRALHREVLREFARCRHQALDRALLRPTASYAGDPEECRRADGSPQEPGIGNVFDGSGDRAAFAGAGGRSRGA